MIIGKIKLKLYAPWVHSLKEKRMLVKSLCAKVKNTFNVSIAEVCEQDTHQTIVLGIACVSSSVIHASNMLDKVLIFVEGSTEAEVFILERECI